MQFKISSRLGLAAAAISGLGGLALGQTHLHPAPSPKARGRTKKAQRRILRFRDRSRYMPHQGPQECLRRLRQIKTQNAKQAAPLERAA